VAHGHDEATPSFSSSEATDSQALSACAVCRHKKDYGDTVILKQRTELIGVDRSVPALVKYVEVLRVLKAKPAQPDRAIIDAVAIEMDDMIRLAATSSAVEFFPQSGQRGRAKHLDAD
jgi:hypothetical protein